MSDAAVPMYSHTQKALWYVLLYVVGIFMIVEGWVLLEEAQVAAVVLLLAGVLMLVLGTSFQHLTVADRGDHLLVRYGPLPLFWKRIRYEDIREVETGRTLLLDGWGIHLSIRGGWVWNLAGRECVVIHMHNRVVRVGTDDSENLAQLLKQKIGDSSR